MVDIGALFQGGMAGFDRGMEFHNLQLKQEEAVRKKKAEARKTKKDNLDFLRTLNSTLTIGLNESFGENATISPEGHFGSEWVRLRGDSIRAIITANNPNGEPSTPFQNALIKMLAGQTASRLKGLTRVLTQAGMRGVDLRKALRLSHDDPELFNKLFGTWIADAEDREQQRRERRRFVNPPEAVDPSEGVADPGVVKHLDLPTAVQTPAPESVPVDAGADAGASESGLVPTPILDKRIVELDKQIATLAQTLKEGYARGASQTDMSGPQKQYDGLVGLRKDIVTQRDKRKDQGLNERKHTADELYKRQSPEQRIQHQLNKLNVKYDYLPLDQWPDTDEGRSDRDMHATLTKTLKKATALLPPRIAAPGKAAVVKQFTDMRGKIIAAATDSHQRQGLISTLRVALDNNTWEPGILSSFRLMLAEAGSYLLDEKQNGLLNGMLESLSGAKGARIGELQRSISNLLVMDAYKNAAGGQINMREAKVIEGGSTRLGMTPDGQKLLLDVLERRGEYDRALKAELDRLTADFTNEDWDNPARHGKVMKEITKWRLDNPVFTEELKKKLANLPDATSDIPQHVMKRVGIRNAGDCIWLGMKSKGHFFEGEKKENPFSEGSSIFNCELDKDGQRADYIVEVTVGDYLYHTPHARE
ncbi:MAG: hypothetical protein QGF78_07245 [Candidatus Bathyarchaeota archaeon]|nr:hypothetical protein [Candidatus Bathyarchaeota archaeon]